MQTSQVKSMLKKSFLSKYTAVMERKAYSTDLNDAQWQRLQDLLPKARNGRTGRRRKHPLREVLNGLFYQLRTGCAGRDLPHDLPPWATVYDQFRRWRNDGIIEQLQLDLRLAHRDYRSSPCQEVIYFR